ncbi:MAG: hypothetical protein U0271_19160 [Polyangiaceae bacterium]
MDIAVSYGPGSVSFELDEDFYPKDAIYGAAYVFIDRCYVHLDRATVAEGAKPRVRVTLRHKKEGLDNAVIAGEFENEALSQAWRVRLAAEHRQTIEAITAKALAGAAGPPGLDDLLATDIGEGSAFDDPLGIAMSWEEKYGKKKGDAAGEEKPAEAASGDDKGPTDAKDDKP